MIQFGPSIDPNAEQIRYVLCHRRGLPARETIALHLKYFARFLSSRFIGSLWAVYIYVQAFCLSPKNVQNGETFHRELPKIFLCNP